MFPENSKAIDMCTFLDAVRAANGDRKVLMILDNGPIHRTNMVREYAEKLNIILVFLPPYSPQFNPIELVWKTVKARVLSMFLLYRDHPVDFVEDVFMAETAKMSYVKSWKERFLMEHNSKKLGSLL